MILDRDPVTRLLTLIVLFGAGLLFHLATSGESDHLIVANDSGQAVLTGEDVLLQGEPIRATETVRTLGGSLLLVTPDESIALRLRPRSVVTIRHINSDPPSLSLQVQEGTGTLNVRSGRATTDLAKHTLSIRGERFHWEENGGEWRVGFSNSSRTGEHPLNDTLEVPAFQIPEAPPVQKRWHEGSIVTGKRVVDSVRSFRSRTGDWPSKLDAVFGFWVRDRWGGVYLYRTEPHPTLRSAGPDGALFTSDDRTWRIKPDSDANQDGASASGESANMAS
jgi:hypothetical protein